MSISQLTIPHALRDYMLAVSLDEHPALTECRARTATMSTSGMQIAPEQGQFMAWLLKLMAAKQVLEVGVFTGYSSTVMALALPEDGKLIGIDSNKNWTQIAKKTWHAAKVDHKIELILQPAESALKKLLSEGNEGVFDFAFIDADKKNYDLYYELVLQLLRKGGVIALDNAFMGGKVLEKSPENDSVLAIQQVNRKLHQDQRVNLSLIPIGDGLMLLQKK